MKAFHTPAHTVGKDYIKKPATDYVTAKTARKWGVSFIGYSLWASRASNLLDCYDSNGLLISHISFNENSGRFIDFSK